MKNFFKTQVLTRLQLLLNLILSLFGFIILFVYVVFTCFIVFFKQMFLSKTVKSEELINFDIAIIYGEDEKEV